MAATRPAPSSAATFPACCWEKAFARCAASLSRRSTPAGPSSSTRCSRFQVTSSRLAVGMHGSVSPEIGVSARPRGRPCDMQSLHGRYGDDEPDYVTVDPELTSEPADEEAVPGADPSEQPLTESGEGVAEGFEEAEAQLIDNIENAPPADRTLDGFDADQDVDEDVADDVAKVLEEHDPGEVIAQPRDEESRRATSVDREPDELDVTEVVRDPDEGDDDPGQGPGIAADR